MADSPMAIIAVVAQALAVANGMAAWVAAGGKVIKR